jgi:hypothetical protein
VLWKVAVPLGFEVMSFDERLEIINEVIKPPESTRVNPDSLVR